MKSKNKQVYTAYYSCDSTKHKNLLYIKTQVTSDQHFEDKINSLMDCDYYQIDLEYT